jgi:protoheme IX farnesyltransferase
MSYFHKFADYLSLTKPRIIVMVLLVVAAAYYLAAAGHMDYLILTHALIGMAMATGGALALNQVAEEDIDTRMDRTRERPIPGGRLRKTDALVFGVSLLILGVVYLIATVNAMTAFLTSMSGTMYLILYTPLKRISSWNSVVGAIPGAMPPVIGWAAATGEISLESTILFFILFIWQIPHALAIAILYREDFIAAGIRLLPVEEDGGRRTGFHVISYCLALLPIGMMPTLIGMAGPIYFTASLILGLMYLGTGIYLAANQSAASARRLFYVSLVYLPLVILVMVLDRAGA